MKTWLLVLALTALTACSGSPNYDAVCTTDGQCEGGLTCQLTPACPSADAGPSSGICSATCTSSTFATDCPLSNREAEGLILRCVPDGIKCDGTTRALCELQRI